MPFIGTQPEVGGYSVLDALTASATASYTLQKDSVNFAPNTANQLLVSLNGVIQKPGSSFTVSGSTLTFSSALTSSDSIDFIIAMGEPLLIGTPSDATVTGSKLASNIAISTSGNITTTGNLTVDTNTLQVNATSNRVGIGATSLGDTESLLDLGSGENTGFKRKLLITNTGNSRAGFGAESNKLNMFIADDQNLHIQKISRDGNFTATQIGMFKNTGGLCFGTDTADANALDDYEEGTWTPTFSSTSATFAYSVQGGTYTKVGRLILATFRLQLSGAPGGTTSNTTVVAGLPFTNATLVGTYHGGNIGHYFGFNLAQTGILAYQLAQGASTVELKVVGDNLGETAVLASHLNSNAQIRGQILYHTA